MLNYFKLHPVVILVMFYMVEVSALVQAPAVFSPSNNMVKVTA
jgi:hypothetical protein